MSGASTYPSFNYPWITQGRGLLAFTQEVPTPQKDEHTVKVFPKVLDSLLEDLPFLRLLCGGAYQKYETDGFHLRQFRDGNLLQVFWALQVSGFYRHNGNDKDDQRVIVLGQESSSSEDSDEE